MKTTNSRSKALKILRQAIREKYPDKPREEQKRIYKAIKNDFLKENEKVSRGT